MMTLIKLHFSLVCLNHHLYSKCNRNCASKVVDSNKTVEKMWYINKNKKWQICYSLVAAAVCQLDKSNITSSQRLWRLFVKKRFPLLWRTPARENNRNEILKCLLGLFSWSMSKMLVQLSGDDRSEKHSERSRYIQQCTLIQ